jgi:hypothetical protein
MDALTREARAGNGSVTPQHLEDLYTAACAEVLSLEAKALRLRRRTHAALGEGAHNDGHDGLPALAAEAEALERDLADLREQARHVRTAAEWLRERGA